MGVENVAVVLERPRDASHGDLATNVALTLAKPLEQQPRAVAESIIAHLETPPGLVSTVEIAGPGFINFRFADAALSDILQRILADGARYGHSATGVGRRVNVEFVSANPTGPLHVGHGRGAAIGDVIAALLDPAS